MLVEFKNLVKKTRIVWKSRGLRTLNYYIVNYITKKPVGTRLASTLSALEGVWHKLNLRFPHYLTLCLEKSPSYLKVSTTLLRGSFLCTLFILNSLELQKGERIQHRFFSAFLRWNLWLKESSWKLIEFFFTQKWVSKLVFSS